MTELGVQPKFKNGKTYDGRRGRRKYEITGIITLEPGKHVYNVQEHLDGKPGALRRFTEDELGALARVNKKGDKVYLSASQIDTYRRCKRKWAFTYINGEIAPSSDSMDFGLEVHKALEKYLKTGEWVGESDAVECAKQGLPSLPEPKDQRLGIEKQFFLEILEGRARIMGYIDLVVPGKLLKVNDHKTTKDLKWAATPADLETNVQANLYSLWTMNTYRVTEVEAEWLYYVSRPSKAKGTVGGRPRNMRGFRPVSRIKTQAEVAAQWATLKSDCKEMVDYAEDQSIWAEDIDGNPDACGDFGGCPFRHLCPVSHGSLGALMDNARSVAERAHPTTKENKNMPSLMDIINRGKQTPQAVAEAPAAVAAAPVAAAPVAAPVAAAPVAEAPPTHVPSPLIAAAERARAARGAPAEGVNPPPVEEQPLAEEIVEATKPVIPQTWVDRFRKGHKARNAEEEAWRVEQNKLAPEQRTVLAAGNAPDPSPDPVADAAEAVVEEDLSPIVDMEEVVPSEYREPPAPAEEDIPVATDEANYKSQLVCINELGLTLMVDCYPVKGDIEEHQQTLSQFTRPFKDRIQADKQVPHWNMVRYREGETLLAALVEQDLRKNYYTGVIVVDSRSGEWKACGDILTEMANVIIRG